MSRILADIKRAHSPTVFFSNGIGDAILATPALRALSGLYPGRLTIACPSIHFNLCFSSLPFKDWVCIEPLPYAKPNVPGTVCLEPGVFDSLKAAKAIEACDVFLALVPWTSAALEELILRLSPHTTVGFFSSYDLCVRLEPSLHACDTSFLIPKAIDADIRLTDFALAPQLSVAGASFAMEFRKNLPPNARILIVHPDTTPERCWLPELYREVLDAFLIENPDYFAAIVGLKYADLVEGRLQDRICSCLGLTLDLTMALISDADLFLGINSSMLHAADLFRVPSVGLFAPNSVGDWGIRFAPHVHVVGRESVRDITVEAVLKGLLLANLYSTQHVQTIALA